jgi:lysozyme family protein
MALSDNDIIDAVLKFEGGYVNNPNDHGGPTNFGITAADYGRWLGQATPATPEQVQAMDRATARTIYQKWYITDPGFGGITPDGLKLILVDSGVLFGTGRATMWLQQALGVTADGKLGAKTSAALAGYATPNLLPRLVLGKRFVAIAGIVQNDTTQVTFLRGWTNRTVSLLDYV